MDNINELIQFDTDPPPKKSGSRGLKYVLFDIILELIILKGTVGPWRRYPLIQNMS